MGLRIRSIRLRDFRSYESFRLEDIGDLTILVGRNAIGKTNVLESIQLVTSASSFRHPQISQLVREGCPEGRIVMNAGDGNRDLTTELVLQEGKRRYLVNGKAKAAIDVKGVLPAVSFTPDDLELAKKSSSVRRRALDEIGMQLNRNYYVINRDYEKALKYKNRLLKEEAAQSMIDAINETLITCGAQLFCYRYALYEKFAALVSERYSAIARTGEVLQMGYVASWDFLAGEGAQPRTITGIGGRVDRDTVRAVMREAADERSSEERACHRSLVGPHNDKMSFHLDGRDATSFASQGQQRSIVLAWKLAEVDMIRLTMGMEPVLLLDDVMSELDVERRNMLVGNVTGETQTFITATDLSAFDEGLLSRARVVDLGERL